MFFKKLFKQKAVVSNNSTIVQNGRGSTVVVNGQTYETKGNNISVKNGKVIVDGQEVYPTHNTESKNLVEIHIYGDALDVTSDRSVTVHGTVEGNVKARGIVTCGDVGDSVESKGDVHCDDISGDVKADGSVTCDKVYGDVYVEGTFQED